MRQRELIAGLVLGAAGFTANLFHLPISLGGDFIFGSVFSMYAMLRFGFSSGVLAAVISACCTYLLWNHPWTILIFSAEALTVGWLMTRRRMNLLTADIFYWFTLGLVLVWLTHYGVLGFTSQTTLFVILKQTINGILNTIVAKLLFLAYLHKHRRDSAPTSLQQYILLATEAMVLIPAILLIAFALRIDLQRELSNTQFRAERLAHIAGNALAALFYEKQTALAGFAKVLNGGAITPAGTQRALEQFHAAIPDFNRMGVLDRNHITTAFSPSRDEQNRSTIGINLGDRPYIPLLLKAGELPVLQAFNGHVGTQGPRLIMLQPFQKNRQYQGALFGTVSLDQTLAILQQMSKGMPVQVSLLDSSRRVISSTRKDQVFLSPFTLPAGGSLIPVNKDLKQWIPAKQPGVSSMKRWLLSFYVAEAKLPSAGNITIVVEYSLAPLLNTYSMHLVYILGILLATLLAVIAFSHLIARQLARPFIALGEMSRVLPEKAAVGEPLPDTLPTFAEDAELQDNFRKMHETLISSFGELEERVAERTEELQISKEAWERTFNAMADPVFILDRNYTIIRVNHAATERLGLSADLINGRHCYQLLCQCPSPPESCPQTKTLHNMSFNGVEVHLESLHGDFIISTTPIFDSNGEYEASVYLAHDISERSRHTAELEVARDEANAASRAKSEFLANMSHEIRTPMNGVIGMAQLLRFTELTAEQNEYLESIESSADNLLSLINDILDLSKIESGRLELESIDFSVQMAISNVLRTQQSRISQKRLQVRTRFDAAVPELVHGDQLRFKQILLNLLGNAIKFTEQGEICISVDVKECEGNQIILHLTVRDTGVGITAEAMERIFQPFTQADNSTTRKFGGTGLGLTICRKLAETMGGVIWAESSADSGEIGSSFHLELPFTVRTTGADIVQSARTAPNWQGAPLHLLVAEDNPMNARFIELLLRKLGHQVTCVQNGLRALDAWRANRYDGILMDIQMPVMGGDEAVRQLRQEEAERGGHIPIIALTAHALRGDRERLLDGGFDGYVSKPVTAQMLMDELSRLYLTEGADLD